MGGRLNEISADGVAHYHLMAATPEFEENILNNIFCSVCITGQIISDATKHFVVFLKDLLKFSVLALIHLKGNVPNSPRFLQYSASIPPQKGPPARDSQIFLNSYKGR